MGERGVLDFQVGGINNYLYIYTPDFSEIF